MSLEKLDQHWWVSTNEFQDVADCLELTELTLKNMKHLSDSAIIKSLFVNVHNALSSACVAILTRTDGGGALQENSEMNLSNYYADSGPTAGLDVNFPDLKVSSLNVLLKKLPDGLKVDVPREWDVNLSGTPSSIQYLIGLRNDLIHFKPSHWSIEKAGVKETISDCLQLCSALIKTGAVHRRSRFQETDAALLCTSCIELLQQLDEWDRPYQT